MASEMQQKAMESDDREGLVRKYLEMKIPADWDSMDLTARRLYLVGDALGSNRQGTSSRRMVSNLEIYAECFGKDPALIRKQDSYDIMTIMSRIPGWEKSGRRVSTIYGRQRVYTRRDKLEA